MRRPLDLRLGSHAPLHLRLGSTGVPKQPGEFVCTTSHLGARYCDDGVFPSDLGPRPIRGSQDFAAWDDHSASWLTFPITRTSGSRRC